MSIGSLVAGTFSQGGRINQYLETLDSKKIERAFLFCFSWLILIFSLLIFLKKDIFDLFWAPIKELGILISFSEVHGIQKTELRELFFISLWLSLPIGFHFFFRLFVFPSIKSGPQIRYARNAYFLLIVVFLFLLSGVFLGIYFFPEYLRYSIQNSRGYTFMVWKPELSTILQIFRKIIFTGVAVGISFPVGLIISWFEIKNKYRFIFLGIVFVICGYYFFYEPEYWFGLFVIVSSILMITSNITDVVKRVINRTERKRVLKKVRFSV